MTDHRSDDHQNEEKEQLIQWMSGDSPKPSLAGECVKSLAAALKKMAESSASSDCRLITPALADFAELDSSEAPLRMPAVTEHLEVCPACREEFERLRATLSEHGSWVALAQALGGTTTYTLVALIGNGWYWLSGKSKSPVRLSQEDFAFRRRLGEWLLLAQTANVFVLSSGQGTVNSLELAIDLIEGARLHLVVTPEHIAATHRKMWSLTFQLQSGSSVDKLSIELLDQDRRSEGIRTIHPDKSVEFHIEPPAEGGYSLQLTWIGITGNAFERAVELPLRKGGDPADA